MLRIARRHDPAGVRFTFGRLKVTTDAKGTTEAPTFELLVSRVLEIAPEIAAENGLASAGDEHQAARHPGARAICAGGGRSVIWYSPITNRRFVLAAAIVSRLTANVVLKDAGLPKAF
jgi:hypothetical protein